MRTAHGRLDAETRLGRAVLEILQARAGSCIMRRRGIGTAAAVIRDSDGHETLLAVVST